MLFSLFTIRDVIVRITSINEKLKPESTEADFITAKEKINALLYDYALAAGEFSASIDSFSMGRKYREVLAYITAISEARTITEYKDLLSQLCSLFSENDYMAYNTRDLKLHARNIESEFNTFGNIILDSNEDLKKIINKINIPESRPVNVFSINCLSGEDASCFKELGENILLYGNERNLDRLRRAKETFHKVVKGNLLGSRIQNGVFDILHVTPRYYSEINHNDMFAVKRIEKSTLQDSFKYLRTGGVIVATFPIHRLYKDVCLMLSKQFSNIQVVKANYLDFERNGLVHIVGIKESSKEVRSEEYIKLRSLYDRSLVKSIDDLDFSLSIPRMGSTIELFKGSELDIDEIENLFKNSSLMDKTLNSQKVKKIDEEAKNPLLPFNIGQLGLVLTSGCLDGIVDEGDGNFHLVKGRVSKRTIEDKVTVNGKVEITETVINKVEINVLLPNGEFKVLA